MNYLIQSVIDYVKKENTDYAIMINGAWGSGKSYFWNNEIKNEIEKIKVEDSSDNNARKRLFGIERNENTKYKYYKTIYVSLYGINSLDEISKSLFIQTFSRKNKLFEKFTKSKVGNTVSELGKLVMNGAEAFGYSFGDKQIDLSKFTSFENTVICFDDLERTHIDVPEVLGFINNLVEHDNIKAIIIANEKEISEKITKSNYELKALAAISLLDKTGAFKNNNEIDAYTREKVNKKSDEELIINTISDTFNRTNEYKRIKEKLIGKTLAYKPDYEKIIDSLLAQYKYNAKFFEIIIDYEETIINIFYKSTTLNLRILKHSLNDYEIIFNNLVEVYPKIHKDVLLDILAFTLSYSFETKSGIINFELFRGFKSNSDYLSSISLSLMMNKNNITPITSFNDKYFGGVTSKIIFFKFVEIYIGTGFFKREIMINEMDSIFQSLNYTNIPSYQKLFYNAYWNMSNEEFEEVLDETFKVVKDGKMHYISYFRGYITFLILERQGLLKQNMKSYQKVFLEGLELAKSKFESKDDLSLELISPDDKDLMDNDVLKIIKNRIIEINNNQKEEELKRDIEELFKILPDNIYKFKEEVEKRHYVVPIFAYYDMNKLFDMLRTFSNSKLVDFRNYISYRYRYIQPLYTKDYNNLVKLQEIINKYTFEKDNSLSISIMKSLKETLDESCTKMVLEKN